MLSKLSLFQYIRYPMRRKIFAFLLVFVIIIQVFSLTTWVALAIDFAKGNSVDITMLVIDEEIEEEGIKMINYQEISNYTLYPLFAQLEINTISQYLHYSDLIKEGFTTILYTPPNFS